jgi:Spy/CpxP family protein refolding chaperone
MRLPRTALLAAASALLAGPALAQAPAPPAGALGASQPRAMGERGPRGPRTEVRQIRSQRFANISPEGRQVLAEAMRAETRAEDRERMRVARDRINTLVAADRLDVSALRRAMEEERRLVDQQHAARQARMLAAFQRMSAEDRKAFAENATRGRQMAEGRAEEWRAWAEQFRQRMRDMPPPPMPPVPPAPGNPPGTF